jgi:hypothetical protein
VLTVDHYITEKIKILKELKIFLNRDELKHMKSLKTEVEVDRFARDLIMKGDY